MRPVLPENTAVTAVRSVKDWQPYTTGAGVIAIHSVNPQGLPTLAGQAAAQSACHLPGAAPEEHAQPAPWFGSKREQPLPHLKRLANAPAPQHLGGRSRWRRAMPPAAVPPSGDRLATAAPPPPRPAARPGHASQAWAAPVIVPFAVGDQNRQAIGHHDRAGRLGRWHR